MRLFVPLQVQALWAWLVPVLKTTLSNFTVESIVDWGTCYATASVGEISHVTVFKDFMKTSIGSCV